MIMEQTISIYELVGRHEIRKKACREHKNSCDCNSECTVFAKILGRVLELEEMIRSINNGSLISLGD